MNEILFFATIILAFVGVIVFYRLFGRVGLFGWMAFASIVANLEVLKCVTLFGLPVTLGNVLYASNFLATDILSECYGGKESRKAVRLGFMSLIAFVVLSQMSLLFIPNAEDWASPAMAALFGLVPRVAISSLVVFFLSNTIDTYVYDWISKKTNKVWVRNNGSTWTSQAIDSILFTWAAFGGTMPAKTIWLLCLTTYAIKIIVAVCDTPFIYWAKSIFKKQGA